MLLKKNLHLFMAKDLHAVGVANGTDAIALCLRSLGAWIGDESHHPIPHCSGHDCWN